MSFLLNNVTLLALLAASGPPGGGLRAALLSPDADAIARAGARSSARELELAFASPDRLTRLAASRASPHCADSWVLLLPLAWAARDPDRALAAEAARAAVFIARDFDRDRVRLEEIPDDRVRARLEAWRRVGATPDLWPDVRVLALETSVALAAALGPDALPEDVPYDVTARLGDHEPEVRRAALELLPTAPEELPREAIADRVTRDEDETVALVAAQILCAGLFFGDDARAALAAMGEPGLERLRKLVERPAAPAAAALDAARCLAADGSTESRAALQRLAARGPRSIRGRIRSLLRKVR